MHSLTRHQERELHVPNWIRITYLEDLSFIIGSQICIFDTDLFMQSICVDPSPRFGTHDLLGLEHLLVSVRQHFNLGLLCMFKIVFVVKPIACYTVSSISKLGRTEEKTVLTNL